MVLLDSPVTVAPFLYQVYAEVLEGVIAVLIESVSDPPSHNDLGDDGAVNVGVVGTELVMIIISFDHSEHPFSVVLKR